MSAPVGPLALAHVQARAQAFAAACAAGDCRYADPRRARAAVERASAGCPGWAARVHLEVGEPVLRWRRCPRFAAWWQTERARIRERLATRARERAAARSGEA